MAQELKSINLVAPGFKGINTEDSPLAQDPSFAEVADNAVIDKRGRIAARKGLNVITTNKTALGSESIQAIKEFKDDAGNSIVFSVGNNKVMTGTTALTDVTPGGYSINANNWKIVNFNDHIYFFQRGFEPLIYDTTSAALQAMSNHTQATGVATTMYGNEVLAAYGRLWTADFSTDKSTIYWSDLLNGHAWSGGTSGSIDITKVWPDGYDEIVALASHNNLLLIFGKHSIVVYSGVEVPARLALSDTFQYTGTDVLFLSHTGLRSFGRTIQEKSMPISSLSANISKDIISLLTEPNESFTSTYHPEENFYLLMFRNQDIALCFDVRGLLENGSYRVTRWPGTGFKCFAGKDDGTLFIGGSHGIGTYSGNTDNSNSYRFKYFSPELTFGDASKLKFLKKLRPTIIGGSGASLFIKWAYDFGTVYSSESISLTTQGLAEYNTAEFNIGEFAVGENTSRTSINANGSGGTLTIGVESDINGFELSVQEINVLALAGRTI